MYLTVSSYNDRIPERGKPVLLVVNITIWLLITAILSRMLVGDCLSTGAFFGGSLPFNIFAAWYLTKSIEGMVAKVIVATG